MYRVIKGDIFDIVYRWLTGLSFNDAFFYNHGIHCVEATVDIMLKAKITNQFLPPAFKYPFRPPSYFTKMFHFSNGTGNEAQSFRKFCKANKQIDYDQNGRFEDQFINLP